MPTKPVTTPQQWSALLRERGLRVTDGRVGALTFIETHPHCSVADILAELSGQLTGVSQQSVHNIVNDLTAAGLLRRVDLPDSGHALYETRVHDNHHHVQCVVCHRIEDIDCVVGAPPCLEPSQTHGIRVFEATITFRGICASCEADAS